VAQELCLGLRDDNAFEGSNLEIDALATNMVVLATYWLSYEFVRNPRKYTEQEAVSDSLVRGCYQVLALITPYLRGETSVRFREKTQEYLLKLKK